MRPPGWFRLLRAGVFASGCVVLSLVGHDLMAARDAPTWAAVAALALLTPLAYVLAKRRRSGPQIVVGVQAVQLGLHLLFAWATPAPSGMSAATSANPLHIPVCDTGDAMTHGVAMSGPGMLAAHALAGTLVAGWLYAGERAAWRALTVLLRPLATSVRRLLEVLVVPEPAASFRSETPVGSTDNAPPIVAALRHALVRRGPPRIGMPLVSVPR